MGRPTVDRIKEILQFNEETGEFLYLQPRANKKVGDVAGCINLDGYRTITIDYHKFYAHHLVILFIFGSLPEKDRQVDHINGHRDDNRPINLRVVPYRINNLNRRGANKNSSSGICGVYFINGRWLAKCMINRKGVRIGLFPTAAEAARAREVFIKKETDSWKSLRPAKR